MRSYSIVWLISLSIIFSRSIRMAAHGRISFFFMAQLYIMKYNWVMKKNEYIYVFFLLWRNMYISWKRMNIYIFFLFMNEYIYIYIYQFFFFLFMATHVAHARGRWIRATAASLRHSRSNTGSEPHLKSTPQLAATLDP